MRALRISRAILALVIACLAVASAHAGDSLYGKVKEVKRADVVVFDYGDGQYDLKIVGIEVPREGSFADQAKRFVSDMVLDKNVRMRFEGRTEGGEMRARLFTDDPDLGIKEVSVELIRAGLARRPKGFDFPYGELSAAEKEAQREKRGVWAEGTQ